MKVHMANPARVERIRSTIVEWDEGYYTFYRYFKNKKSAENFRDRLIEKHHVKRAVVKSK